MGSTPPLQLQVGMPAPAFASGAGQKSTNPQSEAERQEIERLREQHMLWKAYAAEWNLYLSAYEGGPDFTNEQNLFKHARENDEDFLDRVKRAYYLNYCQPIIDFYTNFIYAEAIQRNGGDEDEWCRQFWQDVNRKGDNVDDEMREVSDDDKIYGMDYVLVEAPPKPNTGGELTKQDEIDFKLMPYWVIVHPDEVLDWIVNEFEVFQYVKRKQIAERMMDGSKHTLEVYTEWYPDKIEVSEIDVTDERNPKLIKKREEQANTMGEIPIVVVRYKRSKRFPFMGNSMLRDFAYNNREIMNISSLIQEFNYRQCFNILAKEVETALPTTSQEDGVVGSANVLEYPKGAKVPAYITPPADPAKFLQAERDYIKREMFLRAAQDTLNELFNGEKSSGFSQAQSFAKTVPFIASQADALERTEVRLMQLTMKRMGKSWNGSIKYKDRYEITNLTDAMTQLMMLARDLQLPSPTFVKVELERLVEQYDQKLTPDQKTQVLDEIKKYFTNTANWASWQETQKEALVGLPKAPTQGTSPAAQHKPKSTGTMAESAAEAKTTNTAATKKTQ